MCSYSRFVSILCVFGFLEEAVQLTRYCVRYRIFGSRRSRHQGIYNPTCLSRIKDHEHLAAAVGTSPSSHACTHVSPVCMFILKINLSCESISHTIYTAIPCHKNSDWKQEKNRCRRRQARIDSRFASDRCEFDWMVTWRSVPLLGYHSRF